MSWSKLFIGTPEKVAEAVESYAERLSEPTKSEYTKAMPHMTALVKENFGNEGVIIKLNAGGHGSFDSEGKQTHGALYMNLERIESVML